MKIFVCLQIVFFLPKLQKYHGFKISFSQILVEKTGKKP